jgi:hypothetical protein
LQDQADLFETLFAKASTLTSMQLDHATKLLQVGASLHPCPLHVFFRRPINIDIR